MPNFHPHTLIEFGGSIIGVSGNDIWSCGLRILDFNNLQPLTDPAGYMNTIAPNLLSFWTAPASNIAVSAHLEWLKVNNIGADGKYSNTGNTNQHVYTSTAGNVSGTLPAFCSVAGTWETGFGRGLAHRGRMYLPNYTTGCSGGSELSTSNRDVFVASYASLYSKLVTHFDGGANRATGIVASSKNGLYNQITGVSCDNVYDVQRRRKSAVKGLRSAVTAVAAS